MHFLKLHDTEMYPDQKVIKAAEFKVFRESEAILAQAALESEAIVANALEEAEVAKQDGYRDGFNEGKEEMAERVISTVQKAATYLDQIELSMVDVVVSSVRNIVGNFNDRERTGHVVRELLKTAQEQELATLWVSKEDFESQRADLKNLQSGFPGIGTIKIELNTQLKKGESILETEVGLVESTLESHLRSLQNSLIENITDSPAN